MSEEEIRVAIAEAVGWTDVHFATLEESNPCTAGKICGMNPKAKGFRHPIPKFCSDLNACAEMEKTLTHNQRHRWIYWLVEGVEGNTTDEWCYSPNEVWKVATATALQRCEAFLRCLNLWTR